MACYKYCIAYSCLEHQPQPQMIIINFCFWTVLKHKCVNIAEIYVLYAMNLKLSWEAIQFQSLFVAQWSHRRCL